MVSFGISKFEKTIKSDLIGKSVNTCIHVFDSSCLYDACNSGITVLPGTNIDKMNLSSYVIQLNLYEGKSFCISVILIRKRIT